MKSTNGGTQKVQPVNQPKESRSPKEPQENWDNYESKDSIMGWALDEIKAKRQQKPKK